MTIYNLPRGFWENLSNGKTTVFSPKGCSSGLWVRGIFRDVRLVAIEFVRV